MQRSLVELDAKPSPDHARRTELTEAAAHVIKRGPPDQPVPFGSPTIGMTTNNEVGDRIQLVSHGLQGAIGRVEEAAREQGEWAGELIAASLLEALAWLRTLDYVLKDVWDERLPVGVREMASQQVDLFLARSPTATAMFSAARAQRARTGNPYTDWVVILLSSGTTIPRAELQGLRWLGSKMLHDGPLPAAELLPWRAGAAPRWKWRRSDSIFPPKFGEKRPSQRAAYDKCLAGRDVEGSLNLTGSLIEMEHYFLRLLREADASG